MTPARLLRPRVRSLVNRIQRATPREKLAYGLFGGFGLGFWVGLFAGLIYMVSWFYQVDIFGPIITRKLLELMVLALFGLLLFSNVITSLSTFYLSDDLELLLSLPVSRKTFFYTRLLDALGQSSWMMLMFGLPVFLAFGIASGADWVYYACVAVVIPCFLLIPGAFGAIVASALVTGVSARRAREALLVVGVLFLVGTFILLRMMQPERLVNAEDFESVAAYLATMQNPMPALFPPRWAAGVLGASLQGRPIPWVEFGLLVTGAVGFTGISRHITTWLFPDGWTRAQEASRARLAKAGLFHRVVTGLTSPLPPGMQAVLVKDAKSFIRDPAQWSQVFLLISLVVIYLYSIRAFPTEVLGGYMQDFRNVISFLNLGLAGFVVSAISVRFQYAQISGEGRAFWILRTAPLRAQSYLWAKAIPGMVPMLVVGVIITVVANIMLETPTPLTFISLGTAVAYTFGISGIAIGMGAASPDFKVDNVARAAAGPGAIVFMMVSLAYIGLVVALQAAPALLLIRAEYLDVSLVAWEWGVCAGAWVMVAVVSGLAAWLPIKWAADGLWARAL